jgi:hypothetical protein
MVGRSFERVDLFDILIGGVVLDGLKGGDLFVEKVDNGLLIPGGLEAELRAVGHIHVHSHHSHVHVHREPSEHGKILIIITHQKLSQLHLVEPAYPIHIHHVHAPEHVVLPHHVASHASTHIHEVRHVHLWIHSHAEHRPVAVAAVRRGSWVLNSCPSVEVDGLVLRLVKVDATAWRFGALFILNLGFGASERLLETGASLGHGCSIVWGISCVLERSGGLGIFPFLGRHFDVLYVLSGLIFRI